MRVIGGRLGGRRLAAPRGARTRPSSDKLREALFSILGELADQRVLDLYAGTGAVGIEALSRGAARVCFVENARPALTVLDENLRALGLAPEAAVLRWPAARALAELARRGERFELIFADPPYADAEAAAAALFEWAPRLLAPAGRLVLEHASRAQSPAPRPPFALERTRRYGEASLAFYRMESDAPPTPPEDEMRLTRRTSEVTPSATLALAQRAREMAEAGQDVVSLTTGEPDFPPPAPVLEAMKASLDRQETRYTAVTGLPELKEAIRASFRAQGRDYDPSQILVSSGAKQAIFNALLALVEEGDEAVIIAPYWLSYPDMVRFAGGKVVTVATREEAGFEPSAEALERALSPRTRVVILNSPSNPAGAVYGRETLAALAEVLRRRPEVVIIADEIYDCFVYGGTAYSALLDVAPDLAPRTLVVNGCSKRYAMTGLRIGWAAGPKTLISAMGKIQGHSTSNPNATAQHGALAALTGDQTPVQHMAEAFDIRRRFVMGRLLSFPGVSCFDPRGAFYAFPNLGAFVGRRLPDGSTIDDAFSLTAYLLHEHALVVVPGGPFGAPNHLRLSFAADMEMLAKGLERLGRALTELR